MAGWLAGEWRGRKPMLAAMLFILMLGLSLGLAAPHSLDTETLERTRLFVGNYIQALPEASIEPGAEFKQAFLLNGALIAALGLAGLSLLGLPLAAALLFVKGLSLGYAISFLLDYQGLSGFIVIFLSMLPQHLLLLPAFVLAAALSAAFSLALFGYKTARTWELGLYGLRFATLLAAVAVASLIQGYICPLLLKLFFVII